MNPFKHLVSVPRTNVSFDTHKIKLNVWLRSKNIIDSALLSCEDPGNFVRGGQTLTMFFFFFFFFFCDEGREDKRDIIGPPGFRWRADNGPSLNAGLIGSGDPDQYC